MNKPLTDDCPMPFGEYKGRDMESLPAYYLMFLWDENNSKFKSGKIPSDRPLFRVMEYIDDNLQVLQKELSSSR